MLGFVVVGDHGRKTTCGTDLMTLAPNLVSEIERLLPHARNATTDCDILIEIERLLVVEFQSRKNDAAPSAAAVSEAIQ